MSQWRDDKRLRVPHAGSVIRRVRPGTPAQVSGWFSSPLVLAAAGTIADSEGERELRLGLRGDIGWQGQPVPRDL